MYNCRCYEGVAFWHTGNQKKRCHQEGVHSNENDDVV